jgi:hypothetical protein
MDEKEFLWDWLKHENNILANRGSFFLIAESVLFAIIAGRFSSTTSPLPWTLYVSGITITLVWLFVNLKHIYGTHQLIEDKLKTFKDHPWTKIQENRAKWPWSNHKLFGIFLPSLFLVLWFYLFIPYLCKL